MLTVVLVVCLVVGMIGAFIIMNKKSAPKTAKQSRPPLPPSTCGVRSTPPKTPSAPPLAAKAQPSHVVVEDDDDVITSLSIGLAMDAVIDSDGDGKTDLFDSNPYVPEPEIERYSTPASYDPGPSYESSYDSGSDYSGDSGGGCDSCD